MTKLNNRGWGLGALIAGIGVFALALLIVAILVHNGAQVLEPDYNGNNDLNSEYNNYDYTTLEDKVSYAADMYVSKKYSENIEEDTLVTVTLKKLQKEDFIDNIYDLKDTYKKCSGYVTFYKKNGKYNYEPYINCKNYKTNGYNERYDDK